MNAFWWELSDTIKNRKEPYELVEEENAFIDEMESIEDDVVEVNVYKELDEMKIDIDEDLHQRERGSRSYKSDVDIYRNICLYCLYCNCWSYCIEMV